MVICPTVARIDVPGGIVCPGTANRSYMLYFSGLNVIFCFLKDFQLNDALDNLLNLWRIWTLGRLDDSKDKNDHILWKVTNSSNCILLNLAILQKRYIFFYMAFLIRCRHFLDLIEFVKFSATIYVVLLFIEPAVLQCKLLEITNFLFWRTTAELVSMKTPMAFVFSQAAQTLFVIYIRDSIALRFVKKMNENRSKIALKFDL